MSSSAREAREPHRIRTAGVVCRGCHRVVELNTRCPHDGWQVAHGCMDWEVEVLVLTAGTVPSLWRAGKPEPSSASQG